MMFAVKPQSRGRLALWETLECRQLFSLDVDTSGFTTVSPSAKSRMIYVSASAGSNSNSGLSPSAPVASLARGETLVRDGSADQLLLKAGDTWTSTFPQWTASGVNAQNPILIGSYGSGARPLILTGAVASAFSTNGSTPVNNVVISGLQFRSDVRDPSSPNFDVQTARYQYSGFRWYAPTNNLLLQDCSFRYYADNIDIEGLNGSVGGVTLFGCQSLDSYVDPYGGHRSQGFYGYNINGMTIQNSLFDHDGWNTTVPNAGQSGYDHDIYLSSTVSNAVIESNVIANASNNGVLARGGGNIEDNFFLNDPSAISFGASPGSESTPGGVHGEIINNVIMGDASLGTMPYGYGITIANTTPGTTTLVANNIFTGDTQRAKPAIELTSVSNTKNPSACVGINDLVIENNLFNNWYRPLAIDGSLVPGGTGATALDDVVIDNNNFQDAGDYLVRYDTAFSPAAIQWNNNTYSDSHTQNWFELNGNVLTLAEWKARVEPTANSRIASYPNGSATEATYDASLGGAGTTASFMAAERAQTQSSWNPADLADAVNNYARTAFGLPTAPVAVASALAVTSASVLPTATVATTDPATAADIYTFTVTYTDTSTLQSTSIASGNVAVTGPNGFNQPAALLSVTPGNNGDSAIATYSITPPQPGWSGNSDGAYSILMQANQVFNTAGMAVRQGDIGSFAVMLPVVIDGTSGNDKISVKVVKQNLVVTVNRTVTRYSLAYVPELEIDGGDGNDHITVSPHVMPTLIHCGTGNDVVQTANGNDTLMAGSGNDRLSASGANNLLIGGTGNDQLISVGGPNLLLGGSGNSSLRGSRGEDVLISGSGNDRLQAGAGSQLLIAGVPDSEDPAALASLLAAWSSSQTYTQKIAALAPVSTATAASPFSIASITFAPSPNVDTLIGGAHSDWFILSSDDRVARRSLADITTDLP